MKIGLDHYPDEASNDSEDEEAGDVKVRMLNVRNITIIIISYRKLPQVRRQELEDDGAEMPLSLTLMAQPLRSLSMLFADSFYITLTNFTLYSLYIH